MAMFHLSNLRRVKFKTDEAALALRSLVALACQPERSCKTLKLCPASRTWWTASVMEKMKQFRIHSLKMKVLSMLLESAKMGRSLTTLNMT